MADERIPEVLASLVNQLAQLPGFGPKSAMRAAMKLLEWPREKTEQLGKSIVELRERLTLCSRCFGLSEQDPCRICADPARGRESLCVVPEWDSMLTLDRGAFYHGQYFVLGGLLGPLEKNDTARIRTERLLARLGEGEVTELILALGATTDAETTGAWLVQSVKQHYPNVRITRLAQGIPLGAEVKYMDQETLRQSLRYRQELS
ncbi:MAG: recombination protein RecR [Desulfovibrionaceae bacterium]|nr:recombination protein RecR [Desulfovibrionaceae bacterium]